MAIERSEGAVRKRDQIQKAQRMMFVWVAAMSIVVGFSLVIAWLLFQQLLFRTSVVNAKYDTVNQLEDNNAVVAELQQNIRKLEASEALIDVKANEDDKALQVILDALPADDNSLALGASVQQKLAKNLPGLKIEALSTVPVDSEDGEVVESSNDNEGGSDNVLAFRMVVSSRNANTLKDLLNRFQRSIRVIDIDQLKLDRSQNEYTLTIEAHAYYEPPKVIELESKTIKPGGEDKS